MPSPIVLRIRVVSLSLSLSLSRHKPTTQSCYLTMIKSILSNSRPTHTVPIRDQRVNSMVLASSRNGTPIDDVCDSETERNAKDATVSATHNNKFQVCIMCGETKPISNFSTVLRRRKSRVCRFCVKPKVMSSYDEGNGSPLLKSGTCSGMSVDATAKKATRVFVHVDSSFLHHGAKESSSSAVPVPEIV
jgi:hypothetical protein